MPSRGTHGLRKYGQKRTSTAMSGRSAIAFSNRRLPMKHQGQTTSDTISIGRAEVMAGSSCGPARLGPPSLGGNLRMGAEARHQSADVVGGLARGERDRRPDRAAIGDAVEGEACNRKRAAGLIALLHGAPEVAPEGLRSEQARVWIDDALAL